MERRLRRSLVGAGRVLMTQRKSTTPRVYVEFTDGSSIVVRSGAFAQIAAKRRYGLEPLREGDPEVVLYAVWIETNGIPKGPTPDADFDEWLKTVAGIELDQDPEEDPEDPTPAESSASLLVSPPTSD